MDVTDFETGQAVRVIKLPPAEPTDDFLNATGTVAEPDFGSLLMGCVKVDLDAPHGEVLWLLCYPDELELVDGDS